VRELANKLLKLAAAPRRDRDRTSLSPVVKYHGLGYRILGPRAFLDAAAA
jgi:hypothetical protein